MATPTSAASPTIRLIEEHVIRPALAGHIPLQLAVDAIASARTAALVDPEGESLAKCLAQIDTQSIDAGSRRSNAGRSHALSPYAR